MNAAIEKMLTRHAIRRFRPEQISEAELQQVPETGLYAPSAENNQESRLIVCQNAELNEKLGRINRFMQFKGQNPAAVAHGDSTVHPGQQKYRCEDAAMMGENMLLAAHFPGLGACYVGRARLARVINSAGESVPR